MVDDVTGDQGFESPFLQERVACEPQDDSFGARYCRARVTVGEVERFSAWPFAVYRAFIGAVLLAGVATGWLGSTANTHTGRLAPRRGIRRAARG